MTEIRRPFQSRPRYFDGQLLLASDFLAEQEYHRRARRRHNLALHGWGVVRGLEIEASGGASIVVKPGYAIDNAGREIVLDDSVSVDLSSLGGGRPIHVGLAYAEDLDEGAGAPAPTEERATQSWAVVSVSPEARDGLTLGTVVLGDDGAVDPGSVSYASTRYASSVLAPESVTQRELREFRRSGWLTMPFRPAPLANKPEGEAEIPPNFRVGTTEALSPRPERGEQERGAAGTMAIPLPPLVREVRRFRVIGEINDGEIRVELRRGGWNIDAQEHAKKPLAKGTIEGAPFLETFDVDDSELDPEYHTLALRLRGTSRTSISLIGVELAW